MTTLSPLRELSALSPDEGQRLLAEMVDKAGKPPEEAFYDIEDGHIQADHILLAVLLHLGQNEIVSLYQQLPKWYA